MVITAIFRIEIVRNQYIYLHTYWFEFVHSVCAQDIKSKESEPNPEYDT